MKDVLLFFQQYPEAIPILGAVLLVVARLAIKPTAGSRVDGLLDLLEAMLPDPRKAGKGAKKMMGKEQGK